MTNKTLEQQIKDLEKLSDIIIGEHDDSIKQIYYEMGCRYTADKALNVIRTLDKENKKLKKLIILANNPDAKSYQEALEMELGLRCII